MKQMFFTCFQDLAITAYKSSTFSIITFLEATNSYVGLIVPCLLTSFFLKQRLTKICLEWKPRARAIPWVEQLGQLPLALCFYHYNEERMHWNARPTPCLHPLWGSFAFSFDRSVFLCCSWILRFPQVRALACESMPQQWRWWFSAKDYNIGYIL